KVKVEAIKCEVCSRLYVEFSFDAGALSFITLMSHDIFISSNYDNYKQTNLLWNVCTECRLYICTDIFQQNKTKMYILL
ncbi:hypothetical protein L9F63_016814, partial [Diploptera punctata]